MGEKTGSDVGGHQVSEGQDPLDAYREYQQLTELVWRNRDVIDFTGFEAIQERIRNAERGG